MFYEYFRQIYFVLMIFKVTTFCFANFQNMVGRKPAPNNRNPVEIGGFDDNGHPTIVEVDETVIYKRKYQRGRCCKQRWLFGGVERSTGKCFVKFVRNRKGDTLLPIIRTHCLPGSHMITDGFTSYFTLDQIYGGIYLHSSVVHERNFVNPDDSDIHTQSIESLWSCIKYGSKKGKEPPTQLFSRTWMNFYGVAILCVERTHFHVWLYVSFTIIYFNNKKPSTRLDPYIYIYIKEMVIKNVLAGEAGENLFKIYFTLSTD